jgi:hypothetical protein
LQPALADRVGVAQNGKHAPLIVGAAGKSPQPIGSTFDLKIPDHPAADVTEKVGDNADFH